MGALVAVLLVQHLAVRAQAQSDFSQDYGNYITQLNQSGGGGKEFNVDEFTGAVGAGMSLFNISASGKSFPVGIHYSSSGVKVDDYASFVGLGWNLSAGGSITKITRGLDDDFVNAAGQPIGYNFPPPYARNAMTAYNGMVDCEKDYFVFNAFGMSGSFFYNAPGNNYIPMNGEDLVITKETYGQNQQRFVVRDNMNNTYYFELRETISTYVNNESNPRHTADGNWFLTKVVLADKKEITLEYEPKLINKLLSSINEGQASRHTTRDGGCGGSGCMNGLYDIQMTYNTFNSYRLKQINGPSEVLFFRYAFTPRTDVPGDYALNEVEVQRAGIIIKKYLLEQSYKSSRLMLDRVMDVSGGLMYALPVLTLTYYTDYDMPPPFSLRSQDLMGYFNNAPQTLHCKANTPTLLVATRDPIDNSLIEGASRGIAGTIEVLQTLMLKKIEGAYGRVQEINYDFNNHSVLVTNQNGPHYSNYQTFGLRVSRLTDYSLTEPDKKLYTRYIYERAPGISSGLLMRYQVDGEVGATFSSGCTGTYRRSGNNERRVLTLGNIVAYSAVKKIRYTNAADMNGSSLGATLNRYSLDDIDNFAKHLWGNLTSSVQYTAAGMVVDSVNYIYQYVSSPPMGGVFAYLRTYNVQTTHTAAGFTINLTPGYKVLKETRHYQFNTAGQPLKTTKTVYTYNINYHQLTQADYYVNNILTGRTRYKRAYDYTTTGGSVDPNVLAIVYMNNHGMRGAIIEEINTRVDANAEHMLSGNITMPRYESTLDVVLPSIQLNYKTHTPCLYSNYNWLNVSGGTPVYDTHYETAVEILKVDEHANPVETRINNKDYTCGLSMPMGQTYASFIDARADETGFMGFEDYELRNTTASGLINNNWTVNLVTCLPLVRSAAHAYTGKYGLNMSACLGLVFTFNKSLDVAKTYYIQYWIKSGSLNVVPNTGTVSAPLVLATNNGWTLVERTITGATNISVGSPTAVVDDIRLFPQGAAFNYANFDQLDRKVSECADNGNCTYYEYDPLNRLIIIRNNERNIIKKIEYGIQEQQ